MFCNDIISPQFRFTCSSKSVSVAYIFITTTISKRTFKAFVFYVQILLSVCLKTRIELKMLSKNVVNDR